MKFISHLDMNRFMARLIKKSGIPVWYTEGFNQRIYINFALPLSLGFEGLYEIMEFRLIDDNYDLSECLSSLKSVCPPDIEFFAISEGGMPMKNIGFAEFELKFEEFTPETEQKLKAFLGQESIICEKIGKKGRVKEIDLIPKIKKYELTEITLKLVLVAGSQDNLNPTLVMDTFFENEQIEPIYYTVSRTMLYNNDLEQFK